MDRRVVRDHGSIGRTAILAVPVLFLLVLFVVPVDPSYKQDFYVADRKNARENDRVVVRFVNWLNKHVSPEGEIVEVIGPADNPSLDTVSIMRHYGFSALDVPSVAGGLSR